MIALTIMTPRYFPILVKGGKFLNDQWVKLREKDEEWNEGEYEDEGIWTPVYRVGPWMTTRLKSLSERKINRFQFQNVDYIVSPIIYYQSGILIYFRLNNYNRTTEQLAKFFIGNSELVKPCHKWIVKCKHYLWKWYNYQVQLKLHFLLISNANIRRHLRDPDPVL